MKFGIIVFPGSNCDRDVAHITRNILRQPTRLIWHTEGSLDDIDVVVLPGGFSYGDYLRCGAIARFAPIMSAVISHAQRGKYVLGICNGFQILTECGLLPGALVRNRHLHFICDRQALQPARLDLPWTRLYTSHQPVMMPIAHGEGCYYADSHTLAELQAHNQIVWRYCSNPNGSVDNIAGICNRAGNVLGMMPHPERCADPDLGCTGGELLFQGLL
jgi:phosphoribosylformylglycinamidine synthase subunit I (EC 6.3.5.3)